MIASKALTAALVLITFVAASAGSARATEIYIHDTVTLHSGPGNKFATVSTLGAGEQVTVLLCNSANWCRVQSNLFEGWAPMAELIPVTALGAGGVVLNDDTSQTSSNDADISAIIANSPSESSNSLSGGGGGSDATESISSSGGSSSGGGLSLSVGGSSLLSLKVR